MRGGPHGNVSAGARIAATATAWVHRGSVQLANTTIPRIGLPVGLLVLEIAHNNSFFVNDLKPTSFD